MELKKLEEVCELLDLYGGLLTPRQRDVMELYYYEDFSLSEIGEVFEISRQAIFDAIKKAEKSLYQYEEKLGFFEKQERRKAQMSLVLKRIEDLCRQIEEGKQELVRESVKALYGICEEISE